MLISKNDHSGLVGMWSMRRLALCSDARPGAPPCEVRKEAVAKYGDDPEFQTMGRKGTQIILAEMGGNAGQMKAPGQIALLKTKPDWQLANRKSHIKELFEDRGHSAFFLIRSPGRIPFSWPVLCPSPMFGLATFCSRNQAGLEVEGSHAASREYWCRHRPPHFESPHKAGALAPWYCRGRPRHCSCISRPPRPRGSGQCRALPRRPRPSTSASISQRR